MKIIPLALFLALLKGPEIVYPPIKTHEDLIERTEQKFIGFRSPSYGWIEPQKLVVVDWVKPEYRPIVIEYLKNKAKDPKYSERAQRTLIALDDDPTITTAIKQFDEGTLVEDSVLWQNLRAEKIKYWVPEIYEGADKLIELWPGFKQSRRRIALTYLLDTVGINEGGSFPVPATQWAGHLHYNIQKIPEDTHIDWLFKQWWEHNKEAILAEKFSEATWVPMYKGKPDVFADDVQNEPEYRTYTAATRNDILPIPKTADIKAQDIPPSKPITTESARVALASTNNRLPIYIGLGALLAGLFAWLFSKRLKTNDQ